MRDSNSRSHMMKAGRPAIAIILIVLWALCEAGGITAHPAEIYKSLLKTVINVSVSHSPNNQRLSLQYAVAAISKAAGVPYQLNRSCMLTDGAAALFIAPVNVKDTPAEKALQDLLAPHGLSFRVDEAGLYLVKTSSPPSNESPEDYAVVKRIGSAMVLRELPANLPQPKMELSPAERRENFEGLWEAIDQTYSFFEHKDIDWAEVRARYRPRIEGVSSGQAYYDLLAQFVRELRDAHSWLCNYQADAGSPQFSPPLAVRHIGQQAVVTAVAGELAVAEDSLRPGAVILEVDGLTAAERIEELRRVLRASSERNLQELACRRLLDGPQDSEVVVAFSPPRSDRRTEVRCQRTQWSGQDWFRTDFPVTKTAHTWYGIHPSGIGYIRLLSFRGREEIAEEFDRALESLKETPALILDIRDNPGGYGTAHSRIVGRFIRSRRKVALSYIKNGPGHRDFRMVEGYCEPTGPWQYMKPVALLVDAMTGSAADLFACYMISTGRPVTLGSTTHGNLTGVAVHVMLPCGLIVRVSNGYVCDVNGRIIEGNGNVPQVEVTPTRSDVIAGRDTVLEHAVEELKTRIRAGAAHVVSPACSSEHSNAAAVFAPSATIGG
jgi:C-terminal processing protease CtpA/Prc